MADRRVEYVPLDSILPAVRNPKLHDEELIATSVGDLGLVEQMTRDDRTGRLVSGHGRLNDLRRRRAAGLPAPDGVLVDHDGSWLAPVVCGWASADDAQAERALVVLNQAPQAGGWDPAGLDAMLRDLLVADIPPALLGFGNVTVDDLTRSLSDVPLPLIGQSQDPAPRQDAATPGEFADLPVPMLESCPERAAPGDVWQLGPHRIMCGDCRNPDHVATLLDGARINLAFTSPPYADRRTYDETSGFKPIPPDEYVEWFRPVAANVAAHLTPDGSWFVNIKAASNGLDTELYVLDLVIAHARQWGWHYATGFCWERKGLPQRPYRRFKNQFEDVFQFSLGEWKFRPDAVRYPSDQAFSYSSATGRSAQDDQGDDLHWDHQSDGLAFPGNRLPDFDASHEATGHKAAFPVGLPEWFVKAYTDEGDTVFDPFMGSGSTLLAAHRQGRVAYGMELSARYVDLTLARWERHTGVPPTKLGVDA